MKKITAQELKKKIDAKEDFVLINTLPEHYFKQGHVPGSINIPTDDIETEVPGKLQDLDKEIVVYCANVDCQAAPKAGRKLEALGFKHVLDFEGGVKGWVEAGYELKH